MTLISAPFTHCPSPTTPNPTLVTHRPTPITPNLTLVIHRTIHTNLKPILATPKEQQGVENWGPRPALLNAKENMRTDVIPHPIPRHHHPTPLPGSPIPTLVLTLK
mmetsp:Transcript_26985/g.37258  ORF Transcript_26985/g.37258 Transcript_26985/m.37258 type:complete len:106 (+) Transcript_26985:1-318(+)